MNPANSRSQLANILTYIGRLFSGFSLASAASWLVALLLTVPVLSLLYTSLQSDDAIFSHLVETVLSTYISNTIWLVVGVCVVSLLIGLPLAWLVARCQFPLRRFFSWALILPLAMPAYVVAYVYTDLLDYAGPVQIALRDGFGWQSPDDYWFFDIRSLGGAVMVLALVLYPYMYLLMRSAFSNTSVSQVQASRLLGDSAWQSFFRITLPQVRGVMVAALALIAMETMADFATVHYFAVSTMTTAIYDTWLGYYNLPAAAKLSVLILVVVFVLLGMEKYQRRHSKNYSRGDTFSQSELITLSRWQAVLTVSFMSLVLLLGFVLPCYVLLDYSVSYFEQAWNDEFIQYAQSTLIMAIVVALLAVLIALLVNFCARGQHNQTAAQIPGHLISLGYALPGTVLAIAIIIPVTFAEHGINNLTTSWFDWQPGLFISGSLAAIVIAYLVRFTAIPIGAVREGLANISPHLDQASRTFGDKAWQMHWRIHLPLLTKVVLTSALLVFIEAMKELPAALLLRPFGFETLATYVYQFVSDEQLEQASLAAITIVLVGLIPLIFVNRLADKQQS